MEGAVPAGYWIDRFDRKRVIFIGLFGIGLLTALVTFASDFWSALVFRILFGMAEGIYYVVQFAVAGSLLPENRALVNGLTQVFSERANFQANVRRLAAACSS